jgi:hypothetical protein
MFSTPHGIIIHAFLGVNGMCVSVIMNQRGWLAAACLVLGACAAAPASTRRPPDLAGACERVRNHAADALGVSPVQVAGNFIDVLLGQERYGCHSTTVVPSGDSHERFAALKSALAADEWFKEELLDDHGPIAGYYWSGVLCLLQHQAPSVRVQCYVPPTGPTWRRPQP